MNTSSETKLQLLQLFTAGAILCAIIPGHKPWQHGWGVIIGGMVGGMFLIGILSAVVAGLYGKLRKSLINPTLQEHEARPHLQGDEVAIVVCLTLLAVLGVWLLNDIGAFTGISDPTNSDGPTLR